MREGDLQAIRHLYECWFDAMGRGDCDALLELVTRDVVIKMPGTPAMSGRAALGSRLRPFLARYQERIEYHIEEVDVWTDLAWARVREKTRIEPRGGGSTIEVSGLHLAILRKSRSGDWRIARDVSSLDGPTPSPAGTRPEATGERGETR